MSGTPDLARDPERLLGFALDAAKRHGATAADAMFACGQSTEVRVRLGEVEQVKQSRNTGIGLRVFIGQRSALTRSSDLSASAIDDLIARTCEAARVIAPDPDSGLPPARLYGPEAGVDLELADPAMTELSVERAIEMAREAEDAARQADPRITNSEGAEMGWGQSEVHLASTLGVYRNRSGTSASLSVAPIAEQDGRMERDYWYGSARHLTDLAEPADIGREAARRTLRRLGARKPKTCHVPVIFEAPVASCLLGALAGAVSGGALYRKASYLYGMRGEPIAASGVTIRDDPHVIRGPRSKTFDGEGLPTAPLLVVDDGVLRDYLLDTYTAKKLGLETNRRASRGLGGAPSPGATNFWMDNGEETLASLITETPRGLLVTEVFGFGVNQITGDYSQGAVGIWIEDGVLTHPVHELTIASKLPVMWRGIDRIANDRDETHGVSAPSFRIGQMTIAGD